MSNLLMMIAVSLSSSLVAQILSSWEISRIRRKEGVPSDPVLIRFLDLSIIFLTSMLIQVCLYYEQREIMALGGLFGAFLAASAWSDAKTGWVPDVSIAPAFVLGFMLTWFSYSSSDPSLMSGMWASLTALMIFGAIVLSYLNFSFMRITPPDLIFVLMIVFTPSGLPQMMIVLITLFLCVILVKLFPDVIRSMIPDNERKRLTDQMEEVIGYEKGYMENHGWFPLGPIALICILVGYCANAAI